VLHIDIPKKAHNDEHKVSRMIAIEWDTGGVLLHTAIFFIIFAKDIAAYFRDVTHAVDMTRARCC
jgi:hypothetical protein